MKKTILKKRRSKVNPSSPGVLVLQWITYALWGWFALSMIWLSSMTLSFFVAGSGASSWNEELAYPLAAVIVLLLFSLIADFMYSRVEPAEKTGASSAIMLIHGVLFTLLAVGSLVTALFAGISMVISGNLSTAEGPRVTMMTACIMLVIYALIAVRTIFVNKIKHFRQIFWVVSGLIALSFVVASIVGPVTQANLTKNDRLIEGGLPDIANSIENSVEKTGKLPSSLDELSRDDLAVESREVLAKNLVEYKPNIEVNQAVDLDDELRSRKDKKYYQLCVNYVARSGDGVYYEGSYEEGEYKRNLNTYGHRKGDVCYKLYVNVPASKTKGVKVYQVQPSTGSDNSQD